MRVLGLPPELLRLELFGERHSDSGPATRQADIDRRPAFETPALIAASLQRIKV